MRAVSGSIKKAPADKPKNAAASVILVRRSFQSKSHFVIHFWSPFWLFFVLYHIFHARWSELLTTLTLLSAKFHCGLRTSTPRAIFGRHHLSKFSFIFYFLLIFIVVWHSYANLSEKPISNQTQFWLHASLCFILSFNSSHCLNLCILVWLESVSGRYSRWFVRKCPLASAFSSTGLTFSDLTLPPEEGKPVTLTVGNKQVFQSGPGETTVTKDLSVAFVGFGQMNEFKISVPAMDGFEHSQKFQVQAGGFIRFKSTRTCCTLTKQTQTKENSRPFFPCSLIFCGIRIRVLWLI